MCQNNFIKKVEQFNIQITSLANISMHIVLLLNIVLVIINKVKLMEKSFTNSPKKQLEKI